LHKYFIIALGGGLGSVARYLVGTAVADRLGTKFHYGTFVINISACIVIGFSIAFLGKRTELNPDWRYLVPIGFVGAYSTFSTFEWEAFTNLQNGAFLSASFYVVSSIVLGLIAVWLGVLVARVVP
jgi:CrcB protein